MWSVAPDNLSGFKKCSYEKTNEITNFVVILTPSTFIISCELWRCSIVTELKDFDSCWSVSHLSFVTCWHLFVISGYIILGASGLYSFYKDFVILRVFSLHFTVTLVGLKTIVRYIEDFVVSKFVKSRFHCALSCIRPRRPVEFWLHGSSGSY